MDLKDPGPVIELKTDMGSHFIEIVANETVKEFSERLEKTLNIKMDIGDIDCDADTLTYFSSTTLEPEAGTSGGEVGTVIEDGLFCCVPGCSSNTMDNPELAIFKFPSQKKRCWEWLDAINRNDLQKESLKFLSTRLGVCRDHFAEDQFMKNNTTLKYSAIPTLPPIKQETETMDAAEDDETHPGALCRLCATPLDAAPVFLFADEESCANLINSCLPIQVSQDDPLPKQICQLCYERLKMQSAFAEACVAAEKKLVALTHRFQ